MSCFACCDSGVRASSYWSLIPHEKKEAEIQAEKWVFVVPYGPGKYCLPLCTVPFKRWMLFLAAFVAQFCNGSLYAWSILNPYIDNYMQNKTAASSIAADQNAVVTFYVAAGFLGFASAIFGPFVERQGPRASIILAVCLFLIGHGLSSVSLHLKSYVGLYVSYGVFCGTAFGITYAAPVSALQKWFPDLRGTAGGFGVCGFGLGAAIWGNIYKPLIKSINIDWFFLAFGCIMSSILLICSFVLRTPPPGYIVGGRNVHGVKVTPALLQSPNADFTHESASTNRNCDRVSTVLEDHRVVDYVKVFDYQEQELGEAEILYHNKIKNLRIRECAFSIDFICLYFVFLGSTATGIIFMSRVYSIGQNVYKQSDDKSLTRLVMLLAVCNFLGRMLCPIISDILIRIGQLNPAFGRKLLIANLLLVQVVVLVLLRTLIQDPNGFNAFQAVLFFLTFSYGGVIGVIPSLLTDMYGIYNTGTMHGIILTAWSICAVGGGLTFQHFFLSIKGHPPIDGVREAEIQAYMFNFQWLLGLVILGCALLPLVRTNPVDRFFPGYQYSLFGRPIIRIVKNDY
ncbi:unnamed protein product [Aphanomyces euteiches]